jgi:AraC-like DNA-binding protein
MTISTLYAVDAAAQASATFREMLQCSCRFSRIVTTAVELHLEEHDGNGHLVFKKCGDVPLCNEAVDSFMFVIFVTLNPILQMLNSSHCFYLDVKVTRPQLPDNRLYEDTFSCPVHYGCEDNAMTVNLDLLDIPLPGANPTFTQFSEEMLVSYLCRIQDQDIEMKVRGAIMDSISAQCLSKEHVANRMNTSVRNLTRKLSEVDLTFNQLVDSIRQEKAISLIKQIDLCLAEIAFQLGFVDANSFIRAFRRWTGMTPGHYRKSLAGH